MQKLSPRMQLIYDHLIPGEPVWDLCCDHGYLGLSAYESGLFPEVFFVDQVDSIVRRLQEGFQQKYSPETSSVRASFLACPGEDIPRPVQGTLVIAGVGAHTVYKIVEALQEKGRLQVQRMILVPQKNEDVLLSLLKNKQYFNYKFCNEDYTTQERGRIRKLLIFNRI